MSTGRVTASDDLAKSAVQLQRILVATDFSAGAQAALDCALGIGRGFQSKIYLVHAIPMEVLRYVSPDGSEEAIRQAKQFASQEMQRLVEEAGCAGKVDVEILVGDGVWPLLGEFVHRHGIDLLVLGTHGHAAAKRQLLGPVAEEIFRLADCPVLTVGPQVEPSLAVSGFQRILYATNFKPHAERAAPLAYAIQREHNAQLTFVHVVENQEDAPTFGREIVREFIVDRMKRGTPLAGGGRCEPAFQVRFGNADEEILQVAREGQFDLIILGVRSGKNAAGQLPSAVAYKLVCQAPCPVLTTRQ